MRSNAQFLFRVRLLGAGCILVGILLVGRLYAVQIVHGDTYREKAERQYSRPNEELWDRGSIFFRVKDGSRVGAATLKSGFTLAMNPKAMVRAEDTYTALSSILPVAREDFFAKAAKRDDPYEELVRRLPQEVAAEIEKHKLPGIALYKERWRLYPGGRLSAHALGFVGFDGNEQNGRYGLERYYNDVLARDSNGVYNNFFAEIFSGVKQVVGPERSRGDIVTSIEPTVAHFLEDIIADIEKKYGAARVGGIIMDPKTGEIYAMALTPTFDPNDFSKSDPAAFGNSLVENVYEMGSIIKPLTMAAGIDAGVVTATSTYYDYGSLTLNTKTISNYDGEGRGLVTMQEVLNQSLNTGAATVALKLGKNRFGDYIRRFGFGEETGIDLPAEEAGLVRNLESGRDIELATASYGQGIALTPIQTVRALAVLGNGGYLVTPHVVREVRYKTGITRSVGNTDKKQILQPGTSEEISRMLVHVVDTALVGGSYKMPQHSVAAKTGTALIANSQGGGYYDDRFLHSFFGYFPAYDPKFIVFLYAVEPKGVQFASASLTEPFMKVAKFLINYYEIPPDR